MSTPEKQPVEFASSNIPERQILCDMTVASIFCGSTAMFGGVANHFDQISKYMSEVEGMQTHAIVGSSPDKILERQVLPNIAPDNVHSLSSWNVSGNFNGSENPLGTFVRPFKIRQVMKQVSPDITPVMLPKMPHVGGRVVRYALKHDIPVIGVYHIDSNDERTNRGVSLAGKVDGRSLEHLSAMIAVSPVAERHAREVYDYRGDIQVIPNPIDIDFYAKAKPDEAFMNKFGHLFEDGSKKTILFVGRPDERKGLGELIDATAQLHKDKPGLEFQLVVCGNGPDLQNYIDMSDDAELSGLVHFTGRVDEEEMAMMQSQSDLMALLATGGESQGIVVLKAFAGNVPTIFGNNDGYASIAGHLPSSQSGEAMVDPKDTKAVAKAIGEALESNYVAQRIQQEQQTVLGKFALATVGKQHAEIYRSILGVHVPYRTDAGLI